MSLLLSLPDDIIISIIATHACTNVGLLCRRMFQLYHLAVGCIFPQIPRVTPIRAIVHLKTHEDIKWFCLDTVLYSCVMRHLHVATSLPMQIILCSGTLEKHNINTISGSFSIGQNISLVCNQQLIFLKITHSFPSSPNADNVLTVGIH